MKICQSNFKMLLKNTAILHKSTIKILIIGLLAFCSYESSYAQNLDIRFKRDSINCDIRSVCYNVQLKPNGTMPINLGGQNYRLFYNSSLAKTTSVTSLLPSQYGALSLVQDEKDMDASGYGSLSFEATLGFLNFAIDLSDLQNGGVEIPMGQWHSTARICFQVEEEVMSNPDVCLEAVWGREGLTDAYATAFNQVSRWDAPNRTVATEIMNYKDLNSDSGDEACFITACSSAGISASDVLVNEASGSVTLQICLNQIMSEDVTFVINTVDESAEAGLDYVAIKDQTVTIPPGNLCVSVEVSILDDDLYEGDETFKLNLSNPSSNVSIYTSDVTITIDDDEQIPTLNIDDITVNEDAGIINLSVVLSGKTGKSVTFNASTTDVTAAANVDYIPVDNQPFSIVSGVLSIEIPITILNDNYTEPTKSFELNIFNVSANTLINKGKAIITILDDDHTCNAKAPKISKL